jgi:translocation and assembly module TamA
LGLAALAGVVCLLNVPAAHGADPQPYRVELAPTGDRKLDATLKETSQLLALRSSPVSPFGLIGRARGDLSRLKTVLESFGYYQGGVAITIDGTALGQADLPETLSALPPGQNARCRIAVTLGPLYRIGKITIDGTVPAETRATLGLSSGAPAVAADVLAGGARLQAALQNQGYAYARVDPPVAYEEPDTRVLDLEFHVDAGPSVRVGEIRYTGLKQVDESAVRRRVALRPGQPYSAFKVEQARKDLLELGVFSAINVQLGKTPDADGRVAITFRLRERLKRVVGVTAAYSTDLGGSGGVTWSNRNLTGRADQLNLSASVINIGGDAPIGGNGATSIGYDLSAKYILPDIGQRDQSLQLSLNALKQSLTAYDQTAQTAGVSMRRKLSSVWSVGVGVSAERDLVVQGETHDYSLFAVTFSGFYDSTDLASPVDDPLHGMRATLTVSPTLSAGTPEATFIITQATVAMYFDLAGLAGSAPGRSVIATRALAGIAKGAGEFDLPPDQRFYVGGSGTVRGYRYQSVGPTFPAGTPLAGTPIGGTAFEAVGVELRQRIGTNLGFAVFADGGEVSESTNPTAGEFRVGVGAGIRYYTPIGPIRFDLAFPTRRQPEDDKFEVYIGLGQAF